MQTNETGGVEIVGYSSDGEPITGKEFIERIRRSEEDYELGDYVTLEELKKESENW